MVSRPVKEILSPTWTGQREAKRAAPGCSKFTSRLVFSGYINSNKVEIVSEVKLEASQWSSGHSSSNWSGFLLLSLFYSLFPIIPERKLTKGQLERAAITVTCQLEDHDKRLLKDTYFTNWSPIKALVQLMQLAQLVQLVQPRDKSTL